MTVEHLAPNSSPEQLAEVLKRDGCAVIDRAVDPSALQAVLSEMEPFIEANPAGSDEFAGRQTRRTGGLIARSGSSHALITSPQILDTVALVLAHATTYQLHLTQMISIGPGESAQAIHRDQWAFDFFPFPQDYEVQCNTLWAATDFTQDNGATRIVPGSHRMADRLQFQQAESEPAEMEAGSVLLYTGSLYHGGGANASDAVRVGINITYAVAWLRQEENQYLTVPRATAARLPESLQRLMGYARGGYALGYLDDLRDPLEALSEAAGTTGLGDLSHAQGRLGAKSPVR